MGRFSKEEKVILLIILIAAVVGLLVNIIFNYNKQIARTPVVKTFTKININTADSYTLQKLPGIGAVYAQRIIEYRKIRRFKNAADLTRVKGVGTKRYNKMKHLIVVK